MNTRDILLVGAGLVAGYLLVGVINKNKAVTGINTTGTTTLPDTSAQTVPPASTDGGTNVSQDPRLVACEEKWNQYASKVRFGSSEQMQATHNNFITNCLATTPK